MTQIGSDDDEADVDDIAAGSMIGGDGVGVSW